MNLINCKSCDKENSKKKRTVAERAKKKLKEKNVKMSEPVGEHAFDARYSRVYDASASSIICSHAINPTGYGIDPQRLRDINGLIGTLTIH